MIKNWIALSLRRFARNKTNSIINISGLTLGVLVFLLIFIYVKHEFSYDEFHKDSNLIFRLIKENPLDAENYQGINKQAVLPAPLADVMKTEIAGVQHVSRWSQWGTLVAETEGKVFHETSYFAADHDLFEILTFDVVHGSAAQALQNPYTVALSETTAIKYFGTTNAVGKIIHFVGFTDVGDYTVDLVYKDFPSNSSYQFNIVLRLIDFVKTVQPTDLENWKNYNYNFLVKTAANADVRTIESQLKEYFARKFQGTNAEPDVRSNFWLEPVTAIYLNPEVNFSNTPRNDINRLYMLATIAFFVLTVAAVNYVNLTTARAVRRAREVGVRKVSGANRRDLIVHFFGDALLVSIISVALAMLVTWSVFPAYRDFIGKPLPLNLLNDPELLITVLATPILLALLAGGYPAFVLSSFKPAKVLKGNFSLSRDGSQMRDLLTVFQFTISGALIMAVIVVSNQLSFIESNDPGYDREHIVRVNMADEGVRQKKDIFIGELLQNPMVVDASVTTYMPNNVRTQQSRKWTSAEGIQDVSFYTVHADNRYIELFGLQIIKGRNFSPDVLSDKNAYLINETAAQTYGWDDPVGMRFTGENPGGAGDTVHIIGLIRDIHFASYKQPIKPLRIGAAKPWSSILAVKVKPTDIPTTLSYIENNYKKLATTRLPYTYAFFDEEFAKAYNSDQQLGKLITIFSIVAVIIACFGLYGLSMHVVAQRLKEIGIRKVLGAELSQITFMLSRKFLMLVLLAFLIATPIAYYIMNQWLQTFAYHTSISAGTFLLTVTAMIVISVATITSQTIKAATTNPADVLRGE